MEEKSNAVVAPDLDLRAKLRAPLEAGAVKPQPHKPHLSSISPAYVTERLNDVFGESGWKAEYEIIEANPEFANVVVRCRFWAGLIYREAFGGNDNKDRGDAYKGACTDALGKVASQIGIANDVYKGVHDAPPASQRAPQATTKPKAEGISFQQAKAFLDAAKAAGKTPREIDAKLEAFGYKTASEIKSGQLGAAMKWAAEKPTAEDRQKKIARMFAIAGEKQIPQEDVKRFAYESSGLDSMTKLNMKEIDFVIKWLESLPNG